MMLTYEQFVQKIDQLEEAHLLIAALELDIFTLVGKKKVTAKSLAKAGKYSEEGIEALLNCLVTLKAMHLKHGRYSNTSEMFKHFSKDSPHYKKGTIMLKGEDNEEYGRLLGVIRKGRNFKGTHEKDDPQRRSLFTHAMHERSQTRAKSVAEHVASQPVGRLLDLGSGPGSYTAEILKKDKKGQGTLLDRKSALKVAKEIWGKTPVWKRVETIPGDLFDTEYGEGFDTILFSNILHIYNPEENTRLLKKMNKALNPGGRVVLLDYFLNDTRTGPQEASMFSLTMLLFTETGKTYTWKESEALLKKTGFNKLKRIPLEDDSGLLVGFRK